MASLLGHLHLWSLKKFAVGTGRWKILSSYALYVGCLENEDLENNDRDGAARRIKRLEGYRRREIRGR